MALACFSFPGWGSIKSRKLIFCFLCMPMSPSKGVSEERKFALVQFRSLRSPKGLSND